MWFLIVLVFLMSHGSAQSYEVCSPPDLLPPMSCNYIDYPVLTTSLDFPKIQANVSKLMAVAEPYKALLQACYPALQTFVCSYFYPSCSNSTNQKIKPCVSKCRDMNRECALPIQYGYYPEEYKYLLDCDAKDESGETIWDSNSTSPECFLLDNTTPLYPGPNTTTTGDDVEGSCEPYNIAAIPNTGDICEPFVSKEVFVRSSPPLGVVDSGINETLYIVRRIYPIMPIGCYKGILSLLCQTAYPTCVRVQSESGLSLSVPSFPCSDRCEYMNNVCGEFFSLINFTRYDCIGTTDLITMKGFKQWPQGSDYTLTTGGTNVSMKCSNTLFADSQKGGVYANPNIDQCPFPMAKNPRPEDTEQNCWLPCPDPTYDSDQWDNLIIVGQVFASISFVATFFLVLSGFLDSGRRKFPTNIHLFEVASAGLSSIAFFINGSNPKEEVWCNDAVTYANGSNNSRCAAQGFIFVFFTLCILTWWIVLSLNTFLAIILMNKTKDIKHLQTYYHIFAWGIPLIFTIALISTDSIGYSPPASWCFITGKGLEIDPNEEVEIGLDYGLFFIPIGVGLGVAAILLISVLLKIISITTKVKSMSSQSTALKAQQRIITLIALMLILFALVFEWRFALDATIKDNFKQDDFAWGLCKIKQQLGLPDPGHCPGTKFPKVFNYHHTMFETWLCSSLGWLIFLVFGTDVRIYKMWIHIIYLAKDKEWDKLKAFIKDNKEAHISTPTSTTKRLTTSGSGSSPSSRHSLSNSHSTSRLSNSSSSSSVANDSRFVVDIDSSSSSQL